jgi:hypothetical protein
VVKKQPIAYSYNGVILPALPEWDREMYPYAVIGLLDGVYHLTYHYTTFAVYDDGTYYIPGSGTSAYALTDGEWVFTHLWLKSLTAVWANYDMQTDGGTLVLAASEPTPVYE